MRKVLSKKDIYKLIKTMPDNETIWINDKIFENKNIMILLIMGIMNN